MGKSHSLTAPHPIAVVGAVTVSAGSALTTILVLLFASNVFDPGGALGLKYVVFFLVCVSSVWASKYVDLSSAEIIGGLILFVIWPCWGLLFGAVRKGDVSVGASQVTPFLFGVVLAIVLSVFDQHRPLRIFYGCLFSLAIVVIVSFVLIYLLPGSPAGSALLDMLMRLQEKEGYFGVQSLGDLEIPIIYFGSTLFLVPAFVYYLYVGKMVRAVVVLVAIGATFSKAGISIAVLFGAYYSLSVLFSRSAPGVRKRPRSHLGSKLGKFLPIVLFGGLASAMILSIPSFSSAIRDAWTGESETARVRIGHFHSLVDLFISHPSYLIVGQGAGVPFYSVGESSYVQNIEIDHLNAIRKFGLPWFAFFSAVVFYSARRLILAGDAERRAFGLALISIYFAAGTNPVLTSPLFIIVMTLSYFAQRGQFEKSSQCSAGHLQWG